MKQLRFAVVGIVNNNNHILIGKKTTYKDNDILSEKWHIPGGGVEGREELARAVERELYEEFGLHVNASKIIDINLVRKPKDTHHEFVATVWFECNPIDTEINLSNEISHAKWVLRNKVHESLDKEAIELFPSLVKKYFNL